MELMIIIKDENDGGLGPCLNSAPIATFANLLLYFSGARGCQ